MVPVAPPTRRVLLGVVVIAIVFAGATHPSVNDLPGFLDHTGPTEMSVVELERLDAGCADDVATYASSSSSGSNATKITFIETGDPNASLTAWTERTSPAGADLSTFRVHVESHGDPGASNESCRMGVQYRITVSTSGGSPEGILPDAHGRRILWFENGEYVGCGGAVTSPLELECERFREPPERTWANAS